MMTINDKKVTHRFFCNPRKCWIVTVVTVYSLNFSIYCKLPINSIGLFAMLWEMNRHLSIINDLQRIPRHYFVICKHFNDLIPSTFKTSMVSP
jgi:hypothetical protein